MFTLDEVDDATPIALIKGGADKGEIISLVDSDKYKRGTKELKLKKSKLSPMPDPWHRQVLYIAGPSGSGKSTYASEYIKNYKKIFPKNNVYIFSRLEDDPVLDPLNPIRINIDDALIEEPIDIINEFSTNDLILFDDTDTIQDKKLKEAVSKVKNDILETGRHNNLYIVVTSHLINGNDRKDTRTILNEANFLTVFPKSGAAHGIRYVLKNYIGLSNDDIEYILEIPSRWVTIGKNYPQFVMYENGCYII